MHRALRISASTVSASAKPGAETTSCSPCSAIASCSAARSGPSPRNSPRSPSMRRTASCQSGDPQGHLLLRDQARREQHDRVRLTRHDRLGGSGVQPAQDRHRTAQTLLAQAPGVQLGEAERALGDDRADVLDERPDSAARTPEVVQPVRPAPDLKPVDHQLVAPQGSQKRGGEQREVRESARVDDVVAATASQQVQEHSKPEHEGRQDAPTSA